MEIMFANQVHIKFRGLKINCFIDFILDFKSSMGPFYKLFVTPNSNLMEIMAYFILILGQQAVTNVNTVHAMPTKLSCCAKNCIQIIFCNFDATKSKYENFNLGWNIGQECARVCYNDFPVYINCKILLIMYTCKSAGSIYWCYFMLLS